jgi:eukaryotic-like serine/threonine-protein kinase
MDFGLAKPNALAGGPQSGTPNFSSMATMASMASPVTVAGTLVGTVQYMSPEQIQGKEADARSDIFAFGAMLYEMLTGKRAFEGKSQLSVASAILEKDPEPITVLQPLTPPAMENVVRTCLAKEPDDRFQSAHDLKLQLQWIVASGSQAGTPALVSSRRKKSIAILRTALVAGWLVAAAMGVLALLYASRLTSAERAVRANIEVLDGFEYQPVVNGPPSVSPDGQQLVFVGSKKGAPDKGGDRMLFLRQISAKDATPVAGTGGATFPFWSPDGKYLGFFAEGKLKKVEAAGGPAQVLADAPEGRGGSWSGRGTIIFAPGIAGPLLAVSDGGGTAQALPAARKEEEEFTNRNPFFLPDGKHFLFTARGGSGAVASVYAGSLDGGEPKQILDAGSNVAFSDGYVFYLREGTLTAQKFDLSALRFEGKPISIAANIDYYNPRDVGFFSAGHNVLVYRAAVAENRELTWLDGSGKELDHWGEAAPYEGGTYSPGSQMAILYRSNPNGRGNSLWLADVPRKTVTRLTADSDLEQSGVAAADGNSVFIASTSGYLSTVVRRWLTASGKEEKLVDEPRSFLTVVGVSRDGRYVFFNQQDPKTSFDIYYLDLQGEHKVVGLLNSSYGEYDARLSADNKWLAYISDETGTPELYVTSFPATGSKWQVSTGGVVLRNTLGAMDWSADGKSLHYQQSNKIYNVEVRDRGDKLEFSTPQEVTTLIGDPHVIAISPDGKRTLVARTTADRTSSSMELVLNWKRLLQ